MVPLPVLREPSPVIVWTLRHVLLFYTFFAILLASRRAGIGVGAVWIAACLAQTGLALAGTPLTGIAALFASPFHLQFFLGGLGAWAYVRRPGPALGPLLLGLAVTALFLLIDARFDTHRQGMLDYGSVQATAWVIGAGAVFAVLCHGMARADPLIPGSSLVLHLAAASYAIYLVHAPMMGMTAKLLAMLAPGWPPVLVWASLLVSAVGAGVGLHRWVEQPMTRYWGRRLGVR